MATFCYQNGRSGVQQPDVLGVIGADWDRKTDLDPAQPLPAPWGGNGGQCLSKLNFVPPQNL